MEEIWKEVVGYEGLYQVSNTGRVKRDGKFLAHNVDNRGRKSLMLSKDNVTKRIRIHRLVAVAFVEKGNGGNFVCHKDGDNQNNHAENLYWGDAKTNSLDAVRHGTNFGFKTKGEKVWCSKLSEDDVKDIRKRVKNGESRGSLSREYKISKPVVTNIMKRVIWKHVL